MVRVGPLVKFLFSKANLLVADPLTIIEALSNSPDPVSPLYPKIH